MIKEFFLPVFIVALIIAGIVLFVIFGPCIHLGEFDSYCSFCGVQLRHICPECGNTFKFGAFCPSCGYDFVAAVAPEVSGNG